MLTFEAKLETPESREALLESADAAILATVVSVGDGYLRGWTSDAEPTRDQLIAESEKARYDIVVTVDKLYFLDDDSPFSLAEGEEVLTLMGGIFGDYLVDWGLPTPEVGKTYFFPLGEGAYGDDGAVAEIVPIVTSSAEVDGDGVLTPLYFDVVFDGCGTIDELADAIAGLNLK